MPPSLAAPTRTQEETLLTWRTHPLAEAPRKLAVIVLAYAAALAMWALLFPHPLALFLPLIALTSALREYLFPATYRLTTGGVHVANGPTARLYLPWNEVRRATYGADGVFLSPLARPSRLDAFRGVRLPFVGGNEEAVLAIVRERRPSRDGGDTAE